MCISDWSSDVCSSDLHRHFRQAGYHATTVAFADDARIAEHQQTEIVGITNQPAGALAQHDDRLGQLQLDEWRAAATTPGAELGFEHRLNGHGERPAVDDDHAQRRTFDTDAFQETDI